MTVAATAPGEAAALYEQAIAIDRRQSAGDGRAFADLHSKPGASGIRPYRVRG